MNWFLTSAAQSAPITNYAPAGAFHKPEKASAYEVVKNEDGSIAVLRPAIYEGEPDEQRQIKRQEMPTDDWPEEEVLRHVVRDAINRINFVESSYVIIRFKSGA